MAKRTIKSKASPDGENNIKRGPGRPPGSGAGKSKNSGVKRGPGRPPKSGNKISAKVKRGPGRPPKSFQLKRGPGRPRKVPAAQGSLIKRGPGRPPKLHSLQGVRLTDRDLGKLLDLQTLILDVQRTHYKKSGKFDLSLSKQFSQNFKTVDKIVELLSKKNR